MRRLLHLIPGLLLVGAACSSKGTTTNTAAATPLESCYDTGGGHMRCVATPNGADTTSHDVDDDGKPDTFVCVTRGKADDGNEDDKAETETGDGGKTEGSDKGDDKSATCDGGKTETDHEGESHDGGKAGGDDDKETGAPRCENMGCQDMRKKAGEGEDDHGDRTGNDGGPKKGDDEAEGSDHEHEDGRGDDMKCPTTPPPPPTTPPPVVPAPMTPVP